MSKTILPYVTLIAAAGCATSNYNSKFNDPIDSMDVLGVEDSTELRFLSAGYTTTASNVPTIIDVASLYAGKTQVKKRADRSLLIPRASRETIDDKFIVQVLEDADSNSDKRVTTRELSTFKGILYNKLKTMVGRYATPEQAMEKLGLSNPEDLVALPAGYFTSQSNYSKLKTLAGIYSGTVEVRWTGNGCSATGSYDNNPAVLEALVKFVDANGDGFITGGETFTVRRDVCDRMKPSAAVQPRKRQKKVIRLQAPRKRGHTHHRHSPRQQRRADQRPSGIL